MCIALPCSHFGSLSATAHLRNMARQASRRGLRAVALAAPELQAKPLTPMICDAGLTVDARSTQEHVIYISSWRYEYLEVLICSGGRYLCACEHTLPDP